MSDITHFSINDILYVSIHDNKRRYNKIFKNINKHYENFLIKNANEDLNKNCLRITIGKFEPDLSNKYIIGDGKYAVCDGYIYVKKEVYKGGHWSFEANNIEGRITELKIDCNTVGRIFITGIIIDFFIHLKLCQINHPIIHSSGFVKDDKAILFSTRGGGGKTSLVLEAISRGYGYLGDNYLIINQHKVMSFPTALSIFTYNLHPVVKSCLSKTEILQISLKNIIYKLTRGYVKFFTKINPNRIAKIVPISDINAAYVIFPTNEQEATKMTMAPLSPEEAIAHIVCNQMLEFAFFNKYICEYSYYYPESDLANHWNKYADSLNKNLNKVKFYKLNIPKSFKYKDLLSIIDNY